MKLLLTVLFALSSVAVGAQTVILSQSFYKLYKGSSNFGSMKDLSAFSDWGFNDHCYAMKEDYMFVGEGNDPEQALGIVTTPALEISGNATLLIKTKRSSSSVVPRFRVSVIGGEIVGATDYTVGDGDEYRPSAILLKNLTPTSKIKIEGTYGKFYLNTMKVFSIEDALFYESFDYMEGIPSGEFYPSNSIATATMCDNDEAVLTNIYQSRKNIYIRYYGAETASGYVMPTVPLEEPCSALLSFRIGHLQEDGNYLSLSCSDNSSDVDMTVYHPNESPVYGKTLRVDLEKSNYSKWIDVNVVIRNMTNSTILTYKGNGVNLNDILVRPLTVLDEARNNEVSATIFCSVELIRTLTPNIWCPLCLPFDVTQTVMNTATGTTCELCTLSSIDDGVFKFEIASTTIAAGTPFLVRVNETVTNPVFTGVTIVNTPAATATASTYDYKFVGTYSPVDLETNGTNLFLATDGALYTPEPAPDNRLGGLRAYFVVPATLAQARVMIPETTSNIRGLHEESPSSSHELYDLRGQRVNNPNHKGIYIHKGKRFLVP